MERLEACYFCGTAEGRPLRQVTVTPRRRQDDPDAAVSLTLCRSCERKLERVLEGLFNHVEARDSKAAASSDEPEVDEESVDQPAPDPIDRIDVDSDASGERQPTGRRDLFADQPVAEESESVSEEVGTRPSKQEAEIVDETTSTTARATAGDRDALDGVSVAEYNRVMRLLQNREFPMDRAAFVDLAANAYDLREATVQTVLDAVIDKGSLADRGGELVRPGDEVP